MADTILIVDDEEPVRKTLFEWLADAYLDATLIQAADAEQALLHAGRTTIDLAVLDWNLGAGNDGLKLLEDLSLFHPDVVAILVTGYAQQATPLDALRMGVRDYLDKSRDLTRESFVAAVKRQLDRIAPAKKLRHWHQALAAFRSAVGQVLPLVQSTAALSDGVALPEAVAALSGFLKQATGAADAVLLVRRQDEAESCRAYGLDGAPLDAALVPFARSLAASAASMQRPCVLAGLEPAPPGTELQPFERRRKNALIAPLAVTEHVTAVLELFDKPQGFIDADRALVAAAAPVGAALLREVLGEQQTQRTLAAAVQAALDATETAGAPHGDAPLPEPVRQTLRSAARGTSKEVLALAEAVQALASHHGPAALRHCQRLVESLGQLLDETAGVAGPR